MKEIQTKAILLKLKESDYNTIKERARKLSLSVSEYVRLKSTK